MAGLSIPTSNMVAKRRIPQGLKAKQFGLPWLPISYAVSVAGIAFLYLFFATAGWLDRFPINTMAFSQLTDAFAIGQTHLKIAPAPELLVSPDPFARQNFPHWIWDYSFYNGKYYLYWGPVPALLGLLFKAGGIDPVPDAFYALLFFIGRIVFAAVLIYFIFRRAYSHLPPWTLFLALGLLGLASPVPALVARPMFYEVAVAAAQCFLMGGLVWAFLALFGDFSPTARRWYLVATGTSWGLAIACRPIHAPAVGVALIVTAWFWSLSRRQRVNVKECRQAAVCMAIPLGIVGILLAIYNARRFGSPFEFGVTYQLTYHPQVKNLGYFFYNAYLYLFRPPVPLAHFPYLDTNDRNTWIFRAPEWVGTPNYYYPHCPSVGLLWMMPFILVPVLAYLFSRVGNHSQTKKFLKFDVDAAVVEVRWLWYCCLALLLPVAMVLLTMFASYTRYIADFSSVLLIIGILAAWQVAASLAAWRTAQKAWLTLIGGLGAASILLGVLLGFNGEGRSFMNYNPVLLQRLIHFFG